MPGLEDPVALAEAAAIFRRAHAARLTREASRTANPPGGQRDAGDPTRPGSPATPPTKTARPGITLPAGQPNPA